MNLPHADAATLCALAALAGDSIRAAFRGTDDDSSHVDSGTFAAPGAAFVTLTRESRLRGCVGTLTPWRSLADDVRANARAAAFADPRFAPLTAAELDGTFVEVSVLQPAIPLVAADDDALLAQLRPGIDGLTLRWGACQATYLPSVWAQLPDPPRFVDALRRKAGIPAQIATRELVIERYTTLGSPRLPLAPARVMRTRS